MNLMKLPGTARLSCLTLTAIRRHGLNGLLGILTLVSITGCGPKARAIVQLQYDLHPNHPLGPEYRQLAIIPFSSTNNPTCAAQATSQIQSLIMAINEDKNLGLTIVDQSVFARILEQKNLMLSGLLEQDQATMAAKLAGARALICGEINVTSKITPIRQIIQHPATQYNPAYVEEIQGVQRSLNVTINLKLIDGGTGKIMAVCTRPFHDTDARVPLSGCCTEADLPPEEQVVEKVLSDTYIDFLSHFLPCKFIIPVAIRSGKGECSPQAITLAGQGEYDNALTMLISVCEQFPRDKHSLFACGVLSERLGRYNEAIQYYNKALSVAPREPLYTQCLGRLQRYSDRLRNRTVWKRATEPEIIAWKKQLMQEDPMPTSQTPAAEPQPNVKNEIPSDVEELARQIGMPTVMVAYQEYIHDMALGAERREKGLIERDSFIETEIEEMLSKNNFKVINRKGFDADRRQRFDEAVKNENFALVDQLAAQMGADVVIVGIGHATGPEAEMDPLIHQAMYYWETDVTLTAYYTKGGRVLFAKTNRNRGGSRVDGRPGAKQALQNSSMDLAEASVPGLLRNWTRQAERGSGIDLVVTGLSFDQFSAVKAALKTIPALTIDRGNYENEVATYVITTTMTADTLAENIAHLKFQAENVEPFKLHIEKADIGRIQAFYMEKTPTSAHNNR